VYVRVSTVLEAADIDAGAAHVRDVAVPKLREQAGFAGLTMSASRPARTVAVLTRWSTEEELRASEHAARTVREEALTVIGGTASVEAFEEVVYEVADDAPSVGCVVRAREVRVPPASADGNIAFFREQVVPHMRATAGFRAVCYLIDRSTGGGLIGVVFSDEAALRAGDAGFEQGREEARSTRGVEFGETSVRELLVVAGG